MSNSPIQPLLTDGVFYIDNSSMELFTTCPRQAYYYLIRKLELNRSRIALDFGGAVHSALEYRYARYGVDYLTREASQDILNYTARLGDTLKCPEDDYRNRGYLMDAVAKYIGDYPAEQFRLLPLPSDSSKFAVELPFAMPIGTVATQAFGDVKVVWTGKIDLPYLSRGNMGIMDHKTTSMMGPQFFTEFEIAHQMYGYAAACEFIFGQPCHEITINALGCRKPTKTGVRYEYGRHIIPLNRDLLDEWHVDSLALVSDFFAHCERGYFPKATKWCVGKYGACQYRAICSLAPKHRELALSTSEFKPVTWSPLTEKHGLT